MSPQARATCISLVMVLGAVLPATLHAGEVRAVNVGLMWMSRSSWIYDPEQFGNIIPNNFFDAFSVTIQNQMFMPGTDTNTSVTISNLTIQTGARLTIWARSGIRIDGGVFRDVQGGALGNAGTIELVQEGGGGSLSILNGDVTLGGGGTIFLAESPPEGSPVRLNTSIIAQDASFLINQDNTIRGAGLIDTHLINQGSIESHHPGHELLLDVGGPIGTSVSKNLQVIAARDGGLLTIVGTLANEEGDGKGTIQIKAGAGGSSNSQITLGLNCFIIGGRLIGPPAPEDPTSADPMFIYKDNVTLSGVEFNGLMAATDFGAARLHLRDTITNNGRIDLGVLFGNQNIIIDPAVSTTLAGTGRVVLAGPNDNLSLSPGATLVNQGAHTIEGAGNVVIVADSSFTNNGAIRSKQRLGSGNMLRIAAAGTHRNAGRFEAQSGSTLLVSLGTWDNRGATIQALTDSTVNLNGVVINGGAIGTAGTGRLIATASTALSDVTIVGRLEVNEVVTVLRNTITNIGAIELTQDDTPVTTELRIDGNVSLDGGGTVRLSDFAGNFISTGTPGSTLTNVDNSIAGAGRLGNNQLQIINQSGGKIIASGAVNKLVIDPPGDEDSFLSRNEGLIQAVGAAGLEIRSGRLENNGTVEARDSTVTITGTTFRNADAGELVGRGRSSLFMVNSKCSNSGMVMAEDNSTLSILGGEVGNASFAAIAALGNGFVVLSGPKIVSGKLRGGESPPADPLAGGEPQPPLVLVPSSAEVLDVAIEGLLVVGDGASLKVTDAVRNDGTVLLNAAGQGSTLMISSTSQAPDPTSPPPINLRGTGKIILGNGGASRITLAPPGHLVIESGARIEGAGEMLLPLVNRGEIESTLQRAFPQDFVLDPFLVERPNNTGIIGARNGTTMLLRGIVANGPQGMVRALEPGSVVLLNAKVEHGRLLSDESGVIRVHLTAELAGGPLLAPDLFNEANVEVPAGARLTLAGAISNDRTITMLGTGPATDRATIAIRDVPGADVDVGFAGSGKLIMSDGPPEANIITGNGAGPASQFVLLNIHDHTIQGAGIIAGIVFINFGTVIADGANPLVLATETIQGDIGVPGFSNLSIVRAVGAGGLQVDSLFENHKTVEIAAGSRVEVLDITPTAPTRYLQRDGSTLVNGTLSAGVIDIRGGTIGGSGLLDGFVTLQTAVDFLDGSQVHTTGDVELNDAVVRIECSDLNVGGDVTVRGRSNLRITNSAMVARALGFTGGASSSLKNSTITGDSLTITGGQHTLDDSTAIILGSVRISLASLRGNFKVRTLLYELREGDLAAGLSPGTITVEGDYSQDAGSSLEMELAGLLPGVEHDQLIVTGTATLAGELRLLPANGFIPQPGQQFTFLTVGSVTGAFDTITGPGRYDLAYGPTGVTATVVEAPACGDIVDADLDFDCDVDLMDYQFFASCLAGPGVTQPPPGCNPGSFVDADLDRDGDVDIADCSLLQRRFTGNAP